MGGKFPDAVGHVEGSKHLSKRSMGSGDDPWSGDEGSRIVPRSDSGKRELSETGSAMVVEKTPSPKGFLAAYYLSIACSDVKTSRYLPLGTYMAITITP